MTAISQSKVIWASITGVTLATSSSMDAEAIGSTRVYRDENATGMPAFIWFMLR